MANRHVWTQDTGDRAIDGIHWMMVNSARVALNSTRTHANRQKFLEEAASWPTLVNGVARQYVDAFAANDAINPSKDWSWVDVSDAALPRLDVGGIRYRVLMVPLTLKMPLRVRRLSEGPGDIP